VTLRELVESKREDIIALAARHQATNVRLFGSVARGDESAASDIDLLVAFQPGCGLMNRLRLMVQLEDLLGRRVDVVSDQLLDPLVEAQVEKEAIAL
jgi:hypothetical protein